MERLLLPPGSADKPYILEAFGGENIYVPTSAGTTRHLVTAKESKNAFLICGGGGVYTPFPVPFHYHAKTHHDFLCLKGQMKVWLNDDCRILNPGDYASVAPEARHSYQLIGDHTEILGIVVPGGWEEFFRFIGDVYDGPLWPDTDTRNPREALVPRVVAAADEFDVIPVPQHKYAEPQGWTTENQSKLPGTGEPYFLRNGRGPSALLGGTVVRPIARGGDTGRTFTLGSIEGSHIYDVQPLTSTFQFHTNPHFFFVAEGYLSFTVDGKPPSRLGPTESVFIPANISFSANIESRYAKIYVYSLPGGLVDILFEAGSSGAEVGPNCMIPETARPWDKQKLLKSSANYHIS